MIYLIRSIDSRDGDSYEHRDNEYSGDAIGIGRATDQDIQLTEPGVAPQHAIIRLHGQGRASINALSSAGVVSVNDSDTRGASLKPGDTVRVGDSILEVIQAPTGFDFALTLERGSAVGGDQGMPAGSQYVTTLAGTGLRKRVWSWLLFAVVALVFLLVPASGLFNDQIEALLRSIPGLPDDGLWQPGPLIAAHHIPEIGDDCTVCHAQPFTRVRNVQCTACHDDVSRHAPKQVHRAALEGARCASCHQEHQGRAMLVRRDPALCVECHTDLAERGIGTKLRDVSSFANDHPPFKLSILTPEQIGGAWHWQTVRVAQSSHPVEQSNLNFSHQKHLNADGIRSPDGTEVLECSDCHTLNERGTLMEPITMEGDCSRCHTLVFDRDHPQRQVPHGDPDKVILALEEYYSREYLENSLSADQEAGTPARQRLRQRRRPGQALDPQQRLAVLKLARDQASEVAEQLFEHTTCVTCHKISPDKDPNTLSEWRVDPVRLTTQWLPKHTFNHYSHRMEKCTLCHAAKTSVHSADILIPDIKVCRDCHGGPDSRVAMTCTACHKFHVTANGLMD